MTPEERKDLKKRTEEAIKNHGFMGSNNRWNSIITFPGDDRLYRERVETIVVRKGKEVFVKKKPNGEYFLPGGSTEKDVPNIKQAENECHEEAHINVKNMKYSGITYKEKHPAPNWAIKEGMIQWQGSYSEIYTAEYDSKFTGNVAKADDDPFIRSGKWYPTKECFKFFRKEHRDALKFFLEEHNKKDEKEVTESYVTNYFGNRKLLKKISKAPELDRSVVDNMISLLRKRYSKEIATSKIKREMKQNDVGTIFHPVVTFDFPDGSTITVCICYDNSSFTDGAAIHSDKYGDLVILYPSFFKENKESQIFTILHEIGHIRLNHLDRRNSKCDIFGNDVTNDYRSRMMNKGKAMYPEINADFYAVLNGASMYAILNSSINKDIDDKYDYRFTNDELATRYKEVWNKYKDYQHKGIIKESNIEMYDIACMAVYEMVYQNDLDLSKEDKKRLYNMITEYAINKKVTDKEKPIAEAYSETRDFVSKTKNPVIRFSKEKEILKNEFYQEMMEIKDTLNKKVLMLESTDNISGKYLYLLEALSSKERNKIPLKKFGIPQERKYPLDSRKHVESAIRLFGHCEPKYRKQLAENILQAMNYYHIPKSMIGPKSKLSDYI